jgi:hypothetical protein
VHLTLCGLRFLQLSPGAVGVGLVLFLEHGEDHQDNDYNNSWSRILVCFVQSVGRHHVDIAKECLR